MRKKSFLSLKNAHKEISTPMIPTDEIFRVLHQAINPVRPSKFNECSQIYSFCDNCMTKSYKCAMQQNNTRYLAQLLHHNNKNKRAKKNYYFIFVQIDSGQCKRFNECIQPANVRHTD